MATAIPPKAAEVTSNRPERQKLRRSGAEWLLSEARLNAGGSVQSIFGAETIGMRNLRKGRRGMDELMKKM
jgi:hypothetical protein